MRETSRAGSEQRAKPKVAPEAATLLAWYDVSARVLPWRARGGAKPDPYRVWLSEIMLQQTRVETVLPYYAKFLARWPDIAALANARQEEVLSAWAGLGYYARARNLHACAKTVVGEFAGRFPEGEDELRRLPGIGAYTSAAISAIAFRRKATPVDGNIERVMSRLFAIEEKLPTAKKTLARLAAEMTPAHRAGDFAQALMDLGATICTPKRPACAICPWADACTARERGDQETFPRKTEKAEGALRKGAAFVVLREDDHILLRTRPDKGLLASMTEVPGSEWSATYKEKEALESAPPRIAKGDEQWQKLPGVVRHVFTHFPLELTVYSASVPRSTRAPKGMRFVPLAALDEEALPSVMRKVIAHALEFTHERKARGRRK
ncbi:MAG: A/G-specific adenine glycosylase [Xanthobacteraceae bacterium]|nr:A/G-specific adenine glycosylase [Xanthobacteraceae bacterium]QYK45520.1 MAG: A/G-specific adenine glycosylase [Xanthobacteraceae bacterium]